MSYKQYTPAFKVEVLKPDHFVGKPTSYLVRRQSSETAES